MLVLLITDMNRRERNQRNVLKSDPLLKFEDGNGIGSFLNGLYDVLFVLAKHIRTGGQGDLIKVLPELRRLPPREVRI